MEKKETGKTGRVAVIDIGSNTARIVIANVVNGYFTVIDELKETVRLARGMEEDGYLRPKRMRQMIITLNTFKNLYESHGVDTVFAYVTAALNRAKNIQTFTNDVLTQCGIKLTVLAEEEEAQLIYAGVINSMDVSKALILDIGGASVRLIACNRRGILNHAALPFGTVSLTEKFADRPDGFARAQLIEELATEELEKIDWLKNLPKEFALIGVGGAMRSLGKLDRRFSKYPLDMAHNYSVTSSNFNNIYNTMKGLNITKPFRIKGLSSARADLLPAAFGCIKAIEDYANFDNLIISSAGMREGAMFRYASGNNSDKAIADILGHGINTMLTRFSMNARHADHVYDISQQLFKQLRVLHKLPRMYNKILRVATQLHDIGCSFKFYDHPKHSFYFILNSNLYGIEQKELIMSALVAWMHGNNTPDEIEVQKYLNLLTEDEIDAVRKLGVIVRIAECFDRRMSGIIDSLSCDILGESVILKTSTVDGADCTLEIQDAIAAVPEFRKAFNKQLNIL